MLHRGREGFLFLKNGFQRWGIGFEEKLPNNLGGRYFCGVFANLSFGKKRVTTGPMMAMTFNQVIGDLCCASAVLPEGAGKLKCRRVLRLRLLTIVIRHPVLKELQVRHLAIIGFAEKDWDSSFDGAERILIPGHVKHRHRNDRIYAVAIISACHNSDGGNFPRKLSGYAKCHCATIGEAADKDLP